MHVSETELLCKVLESNMQMRDAIRKAIFRLEQLIVMLPPGTDVESIKLIIKELKY